MARTSYQCTALVGTTKTGKIKADSDGYYEVVLGALDFFNSAGAFYAYEPAKVLFEESSNLMRRVSNGALRGEYGHPKFTPGMTNRDFLMRILEINEQSVSHHIKDVWIDSNSVYDRDGRKCVAIMGRVKPCGPFGVQLAEQLENPNENVCFSIRSLTEDIADSTGTTIKTLREIVTWDYVNEPGISVANKFSAPSLETLCSRLFTTENLIAARDHMLKTGFGLESGGLATVESAIAKFSETNFTERKSGLVVPKKPTWLNW